VQRDLLRAHPARHEREDLDLALGEKARRGTTLDDPTRPGEAERATGEDPEEAQAAHTNETAGTCVPAVSACAVVRSARAAKRAAIPRANDLVVEALEEELSAAARAERLVGSAPFRLLAAMRGICGLQLLDRGLARLRRHDHLAEAVTTEVAVELSTYSHRGTSKTSRTKNGAIGTLVPITRERAFAFH